MTLTYADLDYATTEEEFLAALYRTTDEDVDAMLSDVAEQAAYDQWRAAQVDAINAAHEAAAYAL